MSQSYRRHRVIAAPIDAVWPIVSDPRTHPDWWPDVVEVRVSGEPGEGDEYTRVSRRLGFLDEVDGVWVVDRLDNLKEAHFRCTVSGSYVRFALTPAEGETFVEVETGMLPTSFRWRIADSLGRGYFVRWLRDVLDALPRQVARPPGEQGDKAPGQATLSGANRPRR